MLAKIVVKRNTTKNNKNNTLTSELRWEETDGEWKSTLIVARDWKKAKKGKLNNREENSKEVKQQQ